jgi:hypothetical protein
MGYTKISAYTLPFIGASATFVDATTYFLGAMPDRTWNTTSAIQGVYVPYTGTIRACVVNIVCGVAGTNEAWPIVIRKNDTTDYTFASVSQATNVRLWANYSLNIPVNSGDYLELKTVCPTWATNPDQGRTNGVVFIDIN